MSENAANVCRKTPDDGCPCLCCLSLLPVFAVFAIGGCPNPCVPALRYAGNRPPSRNGSAGHSGVGLRQGIVVAPSIRSIQSEASLRYLVGIGGPLLFQVAFSFAIILATSGGGSFVGLWVMLLAVLGIPSTALINVFVIRTSSGNPGASCLRRLAFVSLILPAVQLSVMILVDAFRL